MKPGILSALSINKNNKQVEHYLEDNMKTLLSLTAILIMTISCGKNSNTAGVGYSASPIATINADASFQTLGRAIASNSFLNNYNIQYFSEYHYGEVTNTCVKKDGWFGTDYMSCKGVVSNETIKYHGQIDLASKQAELNSILSKTVQFQASGSYYSLRTNENITYIVRTDYPIQANPVYVLNNATGKGNQLLYIKP